MLPLAQAPSEVFYTIQGAETAMPGQYLTGNIPIVADPHILRGLAIGLLYLLLARKVCQLLSQRNTGGTGATDVTASQPPTGVAASQPSTGATGATGVTASRRNSFIPALLVFCAFFLLWEGTLRLPYFRDAEQFVPDPRTYWRANPDSINRVQAHGTGVVGLDRSAISGIFDRDYPASKPDTAYRLVFMGDSQSISCDRKMYSPLSYPKVAARVAAQRHLCGPNQRALQFVNAGMSGFSSWQGLILLRSDLLALHPDVVVEAFGYHDANDATCADSEVITDNPVIWRIRQLMYSSRLCLLLRTAILRRQASIVDRITGDRAVPRVSPSHFAANLTAFVDVARQHDFRLVFFIEPTLADARDPRRAQYRQIILDTAATHAIPVIDAYAYCAELPPAQRRALFDDSVHFTRLGHQTMASLVTDELTRQGLLQPAAAGAGAAGVPGAATPVDAAEVPGAATPPTTTGPASTTAATPPPAPRSHHAETSKDN